MLKFVHLWIHSYNRIKKLYHWESACNLKFFLWNIFFISFYVYFYIYFCLCVYVCKPYVCTEFLQNPEEDLDALGLELQMVASPQLWVLGIKAVF